MNRMTRNGLKAVLVAGLLMAAGAGPRAQDSVFGDFVWHHIDAYCTFMRADNVFKFDDPESWRFLAFANYPNENGVEPLDRLFMRIRNDLREFNLVEESETEGTRRRIYRTAGDPVIEVEMRISGSEKGYESTNCQGTLIEPTSGDTVDFRGDCGV
jgi:hypothetical protein